MVEFFIIVIIAAITWAFVTGIKGRNNRRNL